MTAGNPSSPRIGPLQMVRSTIFNIAFYGWTIFLLFCFIPLILMPPQPMREGVRLWGVGTRFLLRVLLNIHIEERGRENIPPEPCIIACKHQSAWETSFACLIRPSVAVVLKAELGRLPLFGYYTRKTGMISVDRAKGASAMRKMLRMARAALAEGRSIFIFPEGTRTAVDSQQPYKTGVALLYQDLNAPILPVALNSGLVWPRNSYKKYPGTIIVEYLPPIPPGRDAKQVLVDLQTMIDGASDRLVAEGRARYPNSGR